MKIGRVVELVFTDPCTYSGWAERDKERSPLTVMVVGYLVKETKDQYEVSPAASENEQVSDVWVIPKRCVIKRRYLK